MKTVTQMDGDLINEWYILALDHEVPEARPLKRWLYDQPYVLFRDEQGQVAVLPDRCLHRGAQLSLGTIEQGQIRCPYHGWKFNSIGTLTEVPSDGPSDEASASCRTRNWNLAKVPVKVQDGAIWVWPGDPLKVTEGPPWRFPYHSKERVAGYFMITDFDQDVEHLIQNFMDVPHTVFVHSKWFRNRALLKVPVQIDVGQGRVKVTYHQPKDTIGFMESILNPGKEPMVHTDEYIFPNLTRVDYQFGSRFFVINSQCSPVSRYKTRVYTWIAYDVGLLTKILKPFMSFYTRRVIEQDVVIMKNQGDSLRLTETPADFKSTQADELHLAIEKVRSSGQKDRGTLNSISYQREREFWI